MTLPCVSLRNVSQATSNLVADLEHVQSSLFWHVMGFLGSWFMQIHLSERSVMKDAEGSKSVLYMIPFYHYLYMVNSGPLHIRYRQHNVQSWLAKFEFYLYFSWWASIPLWLTWALILCGDMWLCDLGLVAWWWAKWYPSSQIQSWMPLLCTSLYYCFPEFHSGCSYFVALLEFGVERTQGSIGVPTRIRGICRIVSEDVRSGWALHFSLAPSRVRRHEKTQRTWTKSCKVLWRRTAQVCRPSQFAASACDEPQIPSTWHPTSQTIIFRYVSRKMNSGQPRPSQYS